MLRNAESENDVIYRDVVPSKSKLPAIEKRLLARIIPFADLVKLTSETDPFNKLIPSAIAVKLAVYRVLLYYTFFLTCKNRKELVIRQQLKEIDQQGQLVVGYI